MRGGKAGKELAIRCIYGGGILLVRYVILYKSSSFSFRENEHNYAVYFTFLMLGIRHLKYLCCRYDVPCSFYGFVRREHKYTHYPTPKWIHPICALERVQITMYAMMLELIKLAVLSQHLVTNIKLHYMNSCFITQITGSNE